jgi:hypothetical protein
MIEIAFSQGALTTRSKRCVAHYNQGRPDGAPEPGVPGPLQEAAEIAKSESGRRLAVGVRVRAESVLGGLHHQYSLATAA